LPRASSWSLRGSLSVHRAVHDPHPAGPLPSCRDPHRKPMGQLGGKRRRYDRAISGPAPPDLPHPGGRHAVPALGGNPADPLGERWDPTAIIGLDRPTSSAAGNGPNATASDAPTRSSKPVSGLIPAGGL